MTLEKRIQNKPLQILQHICFWLVSFFVFLWLAKGDGDIRSVDVLYTLLFHALLMPPVYVNLNNFLYKLRVKHGWYFYSIKLVALLSLSTWVNNNFFQAWSVKVIPGYNFSSYFTWWEVAVIYFSYFTLTTLIKGTRSWFLLWKVRGELQAAEKQKIQLELQALKSQVNPHFLFNTLNGIYSMSLNQDSRLPQTILQLSDLMRYFLYDAKDDFVPLAKELELLRNYISLQQVRLGPSFDLQVRIKGEVNDQVVAPLLLITFLENAFKHGEKHENVSPFLVLDLEVRGDRLAFTLENKKGKSNQVEARQYGGLGLYNIRRRLELLYRGRYALDIDDRDDKFLVQLQLSL